MKSYTDIKQSVQLALLLPAESADMWWPYYYDMVSDTGEYDKEPMLHKPICDPDKAIPCWSLAALLNILNNMAYSIDEDASVILSSYKDVEWDLSIINSGLEAVTNSDPIDACVEMIYKLKEKNLI